MCNYSPLLGHPTWPHILFYPLPKNLATINSVCIIFTHFFHEDLINPSKVNRHIISTNIQRPRVLRSLDKIYILSRDYVKKYYN